MAELRHLHLVVNCGKITKPLTFKQSQPRPPDEISVILSVSGLAVMSMVLEDEIPFFVPISVDAVRDRDIRKKHLY